MSLSTVGAGEAAHALERYDAIIDVRSPSEYAEDRLPGALNLPVLDDAERARVGTIYVQVSPHEARKVGAAAVARNIAVHLDHFVRDKPREWKPLVYCWRGGQRSGSLATVLGQIGFRVHQLEGGYKAFRAVVRNELDALPARFDWRVLAGRTGSGKTRLLAALAAEGAQVLDLEGLARHRGSVLGGLPGEPQPTQKAFDTALWHALTRLDPQRPVFVESESKRVGVLRMPDALIGAMREHGRCIRIEMPVQARERLLLEDYAFLTEDVDAFCTLLDALVDLQGKETVRRWQALARERHFDELLPDLMRRHYDPLYDRSIGKSFAHWQQSPLLRLEDGGQATLRAAARALLAG
jgi:tRNA 2-selenouridine synthase